MEKQQLIFITGGARSGKSTFAERYAASIAKKNQLHLYYIATAERTDAEMVERIKLHQRDREKSGQNWHTIECLKTESIYQSITNIQANSVVLLECLTVLLANELFKDTYDEEAYVCKSFQEEVFQVLVHAITELMHRVHTVIIVSNEVLHDTAIRDHSVVEVYRKMIGTLHQRIVETSTTAFLVEASIPVLMKEDKRCSEL